MRTDLKKPDLKISPSFPFQFSSIFISKKKRARQCFLFSMESCVNIRKKFFEFFFSYHSAKKILDSAIPQTHDISISSTKRASETGERGASMEPRFLPNSVSFQEQSPKTDAQSAQSKAMEFTSRVKHRITELETIIERTKKLIKSRKRPSPSIV